MAKIDLLLATYNGGRYLEDQISSIVNQTNHDWQLIARDDGSSDVTCNILTKLVETYPERIRVLQDDGRRLGVIGNFSRLMEISSSEYTMFSDQDDVWLADKIEISLKRMEELEKRYGKETPILIHSDLKVVNDTMDEIAGSFWKYQLLDPNITSLNRLLIQNNITGCTMIINKALRDKSLPIPDGVVMHDWWIALVASRFGAIDHLPQATMLYRQHGSNVEGAKEWNLLRLASSVMKGRFAFFERVRIGKAELLRTQKQAGIFLERYNVLLENDVKKMLEVYAHLDSMNWVVKRLCFLKYNFFQKGLLRNIFLFFWL